MSAVTKVVALVAVVFFAVCVALYLRPRAEKREHNNQSIELNNPALQDIEKLANAMLETAFFDAEDEGKREDLFSRQFSSIDEQKEAYVTFVAQLRHKYSNFQVSNDIEALTQSSLHTIKETQQVDRDLLNQQRKEYEEVIRKDVQNAQQKEIERKMSSVAAAEQEAINFYKSFEKFKGDLFPYYSAIGEFRRICSSYTKAELEAVSPRNKEATIISLFKAKTKNLKLIANVDELVTDKNEKLETFNKTYFEESFQYYSKGVQKAYSEYQSWLRDHKERKAAYDEWFALKDETNVDAFLAKVTPKKG
ncbi:MAG: hypothetical protein KDK71_10080 [Chlamydiia bacterium]|nr:hypothetical protein [Chlamydiia bacterium]